MTYPEGRQPIEAQDMAKMHPSTWAQEVEQLRAEKKELALQVEEACKAQDQAESAASWADIRANQAVEEAKALRARVEALECDKGRLRTALEWYRDQHRISLKPTIDAEWAATRLKTDAGARADAALQQPTEPHTAPHSAKSTPPQG